MRLAARSGVATALRQGRRPAEAGSEGPAAEESRWSEWRTGSAELREKVSRVAWMSEDARTYPGPRGWRRCRVAGP